MTPQEIKAREILGKFYELAITYYTAKECAKIAVNEIIETLNWNDIYTDEVQIKFFEEVLTEIDKL